MSDVMMVPVVWVKAVVFALAVLLVGAILLGRSCAPDPAPLPPAAQRQLDRHVAATAVDSAETARLAREQRAERTRQFAAAAVRQRLENATAAEHRRADSLAMVAATRAVIYDSASGIKWHLAYDARTLEAATLRHALDSAKAETMHADVQVAKADSTATVDLHHALRADSLVTTLVDVAEHPDQCRLFFGTIKCPTRKQALVGGVVGGVAVGVVGALVATGKVKIPALSLRF